MGSMEYGPTDWDAAFRALSKRGHYLDAFLGDLKRRAYLNLIERWGGIPQAGRVLKTDLFEEAMGPDALLTELCSDDVCTIGIDVSPLGAQQARSNDAQARAHYLIGDSRHLPFADRSFALILSPSSLDHFLDPSDLGRSLLELKRVLQPGGRLIITLDNRQNVFDPLLRLAIRLGLVPYYIGRSYTIRELCQELERAGLEVQDTMAIIHHPRLVAVGLVGLANALGLPPITRVVQRALLAAQRLQGTRWQYRMGCFVAALAVRPRLSALQAAQGG